MGTVAERVALLEKYVTFRRGYESLDFAIRYQNNGGGMVPGPSEWDIRVVAVVPASEMGAWIPAGVAARSDVDAAWVKEVPTGVDVSGVREWYVTGGVVVGVDRSKRVVVYRNWKG
jgi:hypothetical protein